MDSITRNRIIDEHMRRLIDDLKLDYDIDAKFTIAPSHGGYADCGEEAQPHETYADEYGETEHVYSDEAVDFFKVGDVVNFHGGYPADVNIFSIDSEDATADVAWFDENRRFNTYTLPLACLVLAEPQPQYQE